MFKIITDSASEKLLTGPKNFRIGGGRGTSTVDLYLYSPFIKRVSC